jgi:very-short-patch-repair endonuclease
VTRSLVLLRYGWTVLRFTAHDVLYLPRETALAVATELEKRR